MAPRHSNTEMDPAMNASSSPAIVPLNDEELDELANFLDSDTVPAETMDISMLHGFLTALALSPTALPIQQWLPVIWGEDDDEPKYETPEQHVQIEAFITRLHHQIKVCIDMDLTAFSPILYLDEEDQLDIARPWCHGFTHGVWLQEEAWAPLFDDDESGALLEPVFDCADEEARAQLEAEGEDLPEWEHTIAQALPDIVAEIHAFQRKDS